MGRRSWRSCFSWGLDLDNKASPAQKRGASPLGTGADSLKAGPPSMTSPCLRMTSLMSSRTPGPHSPRQPRGSACAHYWRWRPAWRSSSRRRARSCRRWWPSWWRWSTCSMRSRRSCSRRSCRRRRRPTRRCCLCPRGPGGGGQRGMCGLQRGQPDLLSSWTQGLAWFLSVLENHCPSGQAPWEFFFAGRIQYKVISIYI